MKKTLMLITIVGLTAGSALAQRGEGLGRMRDDGPQAGKAKHGSRMSEEARAEIRAERDEIRDLVGAIRVETDETRKTELTAQLRAKLNVVADRMQEHHQKRLEEAEQRLDALRERIDDSIDNRDELIEEQIERLLAGERPGRPTAFDDFPYAKKGGRGEGRDGGRGGNRKGPGGWMNEPPPPPPEDDMPGDEPPPPPAE